ncbi:MAG TPA: hypothetical protein VK582_23580 [Pyrinomonadaceae bacterium]|nr:hypothetical protein [Pyrinomonadaceae bacterium]
MINEEVLNQLPYSADGNIAGNVAESIVECFESIQVAEDYDIGGCPRRFRQQQLFAQVQRY